MSSCIHCGFILVWLNGHGELEIHGNRRVAFPLKKPLNPYSMRVLVVEDEKKTASVIRKALQAEGCAVQLLPLNRER